MSTQNNRSTSACRCCVAGALSAALAWLALAAPAAAAETAVAETAAAPGVATAGAALLTADPRAAAGVAVLPPEALLQKPSRLEGLGAEIVRVGLTASAAMIDVRYRVTDPSKAGPLLDRAVRPVLVAANGERLYVPTQPKVGAMRQTTRNHKAPELDRIYFMLFANPDRKLKEGDTVALEVAGVRSADVMVSR